MVPVTGPSLLALSSPWTPPKLTSNAAFTVNERHIVASCPQCRIGMAYQHNLIVGQNERASICFVLEASRPIRWWCSDGTHQSGFPIPRSAPGSDFPSERIPPCSPLEIRFSCPYSSPMNRWPSRDELSAPGAGHDQTESPVLASGHRNESIVWHMGGDLIT